MKTNLKRNYQQLIALLILIIIAATSTPVYAKEKSNNLNYSSRYITVDGKKMHVALYGDISKTDTEVSFTDKDKTTLVMIPALGIPSPHLYFKPLAQSLDTNFNVVIIEPFGYGLSDLASTVRGVKNINNELNTALEVLDIEECVLLVHSISGVYGLNFVLKHPEKVKGFIAIDNTVYDDGLQEELTMEKEYMLKAAEEFDDLRNSFPSIRDFQLAITKDPVKYGATLPEVTGYTYPESDNKEYIQAFSLSCNENSKSEINRLDKSLLTIKDKKFPNSLPVLMMISSDNVEGNPAWETGHRNQLDLNSDNHELYTLKGGHYIWYTNLSGIVEHIEEWKTKHLF